jgi:hypothetical protein
MTAVVIMLGGFPDLRYRMTPDVKRKARACERDLESNKPTWNIRRHTPVCHLGAQSANLEPQSAGRRF